MKYDFIVRRKDGNILGVFPTVRKLKYPWTRTELEMPQVWITRKDITHNMAMELRNQHYRATGNPTGQIDRNLHGDITLTMQLAQNWVEERMQGTQYHYYKATLMDKVIL